MGRLDGKVAVITGSGRGIGRATAILFAREGASIVVNDIDPEPANETIEEIKKIGGKAVAITGDITKAEGAQKLMDQAVEAFGGLDILVNNAGITQDAVVHKMTDAQWDLVIDVSLRGTFNCIRAAAKYMREWAKKEAAEGKVVHRKIVNLSSIAGLMGNAGQANYSAAKAGIVGMTKTMAREWGRFKINVNCVAPGFIETRLTDVKKEGDELGIPEQMRNMMLMGIPLGRPGKPEDIAYAILYFSSNESDFVTGQILTVAGGIYM